MTRHQVSDLPPNPTEDGPEEHDERKYVDLDSVGVKTDRAGAPRATGRKPEVDKPTENGDGVKHHHASPPSTPFCSNAKSQRFHEQHEDTGSSASLQPHVDLRTSDNYLGETSEQDDYDVDDGISLVLSDDCIPCATEDESHYITTHEIQLSELSDHEEDYELGVGSSTSWDVEEDNRVYSFADYASFEAERGPGGAAATVSTLLESDPREAAKFTSSDESASKPEQRRCGGNSGGQIHLSIRTTSRAINDPSNIQEQEKILYRARRSGDVSRYVFRGVDGKAEASRDAAKCLVAAPARKLRGKEVPEYSSGTSSAVSELDDADKEVRTLTARAFKSLAYPYFDAIHFSTSSESSASEHAVGINRWSTFVDLKYGNVNMDQSLVSHQSSAASFQIAKSLDKRGYKGIIKAPASEILPPRGASSSTKKIELMGKFGQGHGGVIRLTETLNFRCNVKSGIPAGESRSNFAGSRSADEVTRGGSKPPSKTMEGTHKKAVFASSLIKNVISKKMQFEQERKMERGEISEPQQTPSPSFAHQESDDGRGKHSSKLPDSSSDYTITRANEFGDIDAKRQQTGVDTKKGAVDSSRSTLHRSQNSAFRCWKDDELGFQKHPENDRTAEDKLAADEGSLSSAGGSKLKKMAHLFVPNIQMLPDEGEAAQQLQSGSYSTRGHGRGRSVADSKSPEIQINLRRVDNAEPCAVSKLRAPNLGCNIIRTDHAKSHALAMKGEFSDKVPHFMVRDIRDTKGKLHTPIYQVRDVRKLVKSSYHFVSLDNNENKSADRHTEQHKQVPNQSFNTVSPIVIKCQSVNTSSNGKQCGNLQGAKQESPDVDRSSPEGVKNAQRASNNASDVRSESRISTKRQEKDLSDKKAPNQVALQKLQAAVKTMEELYVFEKNEWKRKNEPRPLTDSHVLPLIASEEDHEEETAWTPRRNSQSTEKPPRAPGHPGHEEETAWTPKSTRRNSQSTEKPPRAPGHPGHEEETAWTPKSTRRNSQSTEKPPRAGDSLLKQEEKDPLKPTSVGCDDRSAQAPSSVRVSRTSKNTKTFDPKPPPSSDICERRSAGSEDADVKEADTFAHEFSTDNENYLALPVKPSKSKQPPPADKVHTFTQPHPPTPSGHLEAGVRGHEEHKHTSYSPEIPSATIYHSLPLGMPASQPQVYCFSPAITPAPTLDPFQPTQRKMLLDPSTGNYYLVDTPVQPATKRLFDPETGQYVDVPMPQPPMTPVPMPISPLALGSGLYGHAYMIYPGLVPTPSVIPARALLQSQMSVQADDKISSQQTEGMHVESPFYMSTGTSSQVASGVQQAAANRLQQGLSSISISSQQGPRIIAPPSFDGTTMSFMVGHR